jgi:plasmid stability protein
MRCIVRGGYSPPSTARSAKAEIRDILERAVKPAKRVPLGDALASLGRVVGLTDEDLSDIDKTRDKSPAQPMKFERSCSTPMSGEKPAGRGLSIRGNADPATLSGNPS